MLVVGGRFAKFELILTTRYQYGDIDLVADVGVDLPNLNSSWPLDVSTKEGKLAKFKLILTTSSHYGKIDLVADLG